jgi:Na+-translocating ferredoxin:NAD+ oxidoreductase RNF subunit RnfB
MSENRCAKKNHYLCIAKKQKEKDTNMINDVMIYSLITLVSLGILAAVLLYFVAQKFKVEEDPRIDEVAELLPGANCGGCGYAGCRALAEAIVKAMSMEGKTCPGGGDAIDKIADLLGLVAPKTEPKIAVIRCNGTYSNTPKKIAYDAVDSCAFAHTLYAGEGGCPNGCLGCGDCVKVCPFNAMEMDTATGLPIVKDNCTSCGVCIKSCPRGIIEIRYRGKKERRIFVSCVNTEKGAVARKNCIVACIACGKCVKVCTFEAITMENNVAYIDMEKCKLCRKCVKECPTQAIWEVNFPPAKDIE